MQTPQPSTPRGDSTLPDAARTPRHTMAGRAGWRAAEVTRGNPPFSRPSTRSPGHPGQAPLGQSKSKPDPRQALAQALADIHQRLRQQDSGPLRASEGLELLRRLHGLARQALDLPDFVAARRLWALGEDIAARFPADPHGLDAAVCALAQALRKTLQPALESELHAGLGDWIVLHLGAAPDSEGCTLTGVQLQGLQTDGQHQRALDELRAWAQAQLARPAASRLLGWADLQRVLGALGQALPWQPSAHERLRWCLLEARHGLQAQPLIELLSHGHSDAIDSDSLQAILQLAAKPALALADRADLLRRVVPLLPPPADAPELHGLCQRSLQAIGDAQIRALLRKQYQAHFGPAYPARQQAPGHAPSARVNDWLRQQDQRDRDWDRLGSELALRIDNDPVPQLLADSGPALLERLRGLCGQASQRQDVQRLARVLAWVDQLARRLKAHPDAATSLLHTRCELLRQDSRQALRQACVARLRDWFEAAPRASATEPLTCLRLDPQSPALASAEARQQAWSLFLRWLDLELSGPPDAPWEGVEALCDEVARALQITPDADLLSERRQALPQRPPPRPEQDPPQALTRWFSIERQGGGAHPRIRVARGAPAPANDDEHQTAQTALFNWMLHELEQPEGAPWPALMDLVDEVERAWQPRQLDRQRLLGLCLWHVARARTPGPLLQLLPKLDGADEAILSALLEQAGQRQWSPVIRASLLQAVIKRLPVREQANAALHAQTLRTVLAQTDAGVRGTLLAQVLQHHPGETGNETSRLLKTLLQLEQGQTLSDEELLDALDGVRQRERRALREVWLALCQALLDGVAPRLLALARSRDSAQATQAAERLRRLLWRLAHPEAGDKAQALEDQFDLLSGLARAVPDEQRAGFLQWLDQAYVRQIQRAVQPQGEGAPVTLPIAALAMRGAIAVLSAKPGQPPARPSRSGHAVADAATRFFTDWFCAVQAHSGEAAVRQEADLAMTRLLHQVALFELRQDPAAPALNEAMDGLFRLKGLQQ